MIYKHFLVFLLLCNYGSICFGTDIAFSRRGSPTIDISKFDGVSVITSTRLFENSTVLHQNTTISTPSTPTTTAVHPNDRPKTFDEAYMGCNKKWECFGMAKNGSTGCENTETCDVLISYINNDDGSVGFTMFENSTALNIAKPYLALGLSEKASMANASVSFCYHSDEASPEDGVGMSWNTKDYNNLLLSNPSLGLSNTKSSYTNGILRCEYNRDKVTNFQIPDENKNESVEFDLSKSYYLLLAVGEVKQNTYLVEKFPVVLTYHSAKTVSNSKITLSNITSSTSTTTKASTTATSKSSTTTLTNSSTSTKTTTTTSSHKTSSKTSTSTSSTVSTTTAVSTTTKKTPNNRFEEVYKGCSKNWGCVGMTNKGETNCETSKTCDVLVTFTKNTNDGNVNFTMLGNITNISYDIDNTYIAFGISDSKSMAESSVMFCYQSSKVSPSNGVGMAWNNKDYNSIVLDDPVYGLSKTSSSFSDGLLSCSFTRNKMTNISIPQSNNKSVEFDLENSYYLLIAFGPAKENNFKVWNVSCSMSESFHPFPICLSYHPGKMVSDKKVFLNNSSHVSSKDSKKLIEAHGCLMVLAWILFANVGMFTAKFCKKILPGKQILNADIWFRAHQGCMILAIMLSLAGASILWVDRGVKPLKLDNLKNNPHSALGMAVICAAVVQPVIAFFRPSPKNKFRPYFRYLHGGLGYVALILSGVAMYFATKLEEAMLDELTWIILAALLGFCLVSTLLAGLNQWYDVFKMNEENSNKVIYGLYLTYIMVMLAFVFAMFSVILNN